MLKNRRNYGDEKRHDSILDLEGSPSKNVNEKYTRLKKYDTEKKGTSIRSFVLFLIMTSIVMTLYFTSHKIETSFYPTYHQSTHQTEHKAISQQDDRNNFERLFEKAVGDTSERYLGLYIENNTVYCNKPKMKAFDKVTNRHRTLIDMLKQTLQQHPLNLTSSSRYHDSYSDGVPVFFIADDMNGCETYGNHDLGLPHLAWSEPLYNETCLAIAIPGYHNWRKFAKVKVEPKQWMSTLIEQYRSYHWEHKISKAVWRGSSTGHAIKFPDGSANFSSLPRTQLVLKAAKRPDIFNVAYSKLVGRFSGQEKALSNITKLRKKIKFKDFMRYKAIIDIDGYGWSARFGSLLCTNSVVIKVQPGDIDYYFNSTQPWKHYVPVNANMSNLEEMVEYVLDKKNNKQMIRIVLFANQWCQQMLHQERMTKDMHSKLNEYVNSIQSYLDPFEPIVQKYHLEKCHK